MRRKRLVVSVTALLLLIISDASAQVELSDNPFPDVIARSSAIRPFDLEAPKVTLSGVIIGGPKHIRQPNPYQYFRVAVKDSAAPTGISIWAVLFSATDVQTPNLKLGTAVTVTGAPTKDGSRRLELVQENSGTTIRLTGLQIVAQ